MEISEIKPSDFKGNYAWNSVFQKSEYETIYNNMLVISERLGDKWGLTKKQYEEHRIKDGGYGSLESRYADEVISYMISPERAQTFSPGLQERFCELLEELPR